MLAAHHITSRLLFMLGLTTCGTAQSRGPIAPDLPLQWQHGGTQVLAFPKPPWSTSPVPQIVTKMESVYDWTIPNNPRMRETYHDSCVPIFPKGSMWSCDFVNTNGTSYLLQHADRVPGQPECCVFERPWVPPNPHFGKTLTFLTNTSEGGATVMWWESVGVSRSDGGPFGYGWRVVNDGALVPHAFYFGAFWNWANGTLSEAFTLQRFVNFTATAPSAAAFDLPPSCATAKPCTNWPMDTTTENTSKPSASSRRPLPRRVYPTRMSS
eukprot:m.39828 g.39828  ORF g.39828 m.39828 type:complete len:268 (+) comp5869_c0_seq2:187-990(+)